MKNLLISFILFFSIISLSAQKSSIQTRIEKVLDYNTTWIKLTITNRGDNPIIISDMCRLNSVGNEVGKSPSYVTALAYDRNGKQVGFSNRLNFISFNSNSGINLKKGESEVQVFLLKTDEITGFFANSFPEKNIYNLQLKIKLTYKTFVHNGIATTTEELLTNNLLL